jgi:transcriptional regulator with XRE-family HTH domain
VLAFYVSVGSGSRGGWLTAPFILLLILFLRLGDIARAKGMTQVAKDAGLSRESLYRALSAEGNPSFATVLKVFEDEVAGHHPEDDPVAPLLESLDGEDGLVDDAGEDVIVGHWSPMQMVLEGEACSTTAEGGR